MKPLALFLSLTMMCSPVMADEVSDLIKQLDAEGFQDREQAAEKLQVLGKQAVPALTEAAKAGPLEATVRSIQILQNLMESKDKSAADEAKSALEKLAESGNASTARRAKSALTPKPQPMPPALRNRIGIGAFPNRAFPIPAGPAFGGNAVRRVSTRITNGSKVVEVQENDRTVKIQEHPKDGIHIEVTEKKNGKDVTEKFAAKNLDELKKNNPKGHEIYKQYERYMNRPEAARVFGGVGAARPAALQRANAGRLDLAGRLMQSMGRHLESVADENAIKESSNESREALKKDIAEMKNRLTEIEKQLQKAIDADAKRKSAEAEKPANAPK